MAQISQDKWWRGGVKLAIELSGWLVAPLLAAYLVGKWLDDSYGTTPWLFLGCTAVAFVITSLGIFFESFIILFGRHFGKLRFGYCDKFFRRYRSRIDA